VQVVPAPIALGAPAPRLSPSGRLVVYRGVDDHALVRVLDLDTLGSRTFPTGDLRAVAFLDDQRLLMLPGVGAQLGVLELDSGFTPIIDLGLVADGFDDAFETIDVSANAETFVTTEHGGARVRVIRCDPALLALRR